MRKLQSPARMRCDRTELMRMQEGWWGDEEPKEKADKTDLQVEGQTLDGKRIDSHAISDLTLEISKLFIENGGKLFWRDI